MTASITSQATSEKAPGANARWRSSGLFWPRLLPVIAALLLAISTIFSYWALTLHAPQYPGGLKITIFTHKVTGDVSEVDGLNHYIGMMPLGDAAGFERSVAMFAIAAFVIMGILAAVLKPARASLLALPIVIFPFVFAADLFIWLYRAGHELDPTAALSSSVKDFTPAIIGEGVVGQFSTTAFFGPGFFIALAASMLALAGIIVRFRRQSSGAAK